VPLVSVILPTYNRADVVARAIGSVMRQTFAGWELIVVDDASQDDIEEVVASYGDSRVRYIRRPVNGGVSAAQNTGIDHAQGELVAFLHSDDEFFAEKLEHQVGLVARSPDTIGAVESGIEVVWPDRTECWPPGLDHADVSDVLAYRARVHVSGLLVRRVLATRLRFDEQLRGAEDRDFCIRLLQSTDLAFSREPLSRVSKSGNRLGHQNKGPIYEYLLEKYHDEIAADRRVHADWQYRIARAHARAGQMPEARRALRRSVRLDPARPRRWLLWLASFGGDGVCGPAFRAQVRLAGTAQHSRRAGVRAQVEWQRRPR
jgi:glycosyltransferase involved in cell wall biosynthesis